uniref:Polyprotein n=1 Tax=Areca palm velarivirus 1 TaxID=1654603 RepID=A0A650D5J6_9CLOS|nr:polyprotein [Areca palm velarivirus 1]
MGFSNFSFTLCSPQTKINENIKNNPTKSKVTQLLESGKPDLRSIPITPPNWLRLPKDVQLKDVVCWLRPGSSEIYYTTRVAPVYQYNTQKRSIDRRKIRRIRKRRRNKLLSKISSMYDAPLHAGRRRCIKKFLRELFSTPYATCKSIPYPFIKQHKGWAVQEILLQLRNTDIQVGAVAVSADKANFGVSSSHFYSNLTSKIRLLIKLDDQMKTFSGVFQSFSDQQSVDLLRFSGKRTYSRNPNYVRIVLDCTMLSWLGKQSNIAFSYNFFNPFSKLSWLITSFICNVAIKNKLLATILNYFPSRQFALTQPMAWDLNRIFLGIPNPVLKDNSDQQQKTQQSKSVERIYERKLRLGEDSYRILLKVVANMVKEFCVFRNSEQGVIVKNTPETARIFFNNTLKNGKFYIPDEALMSNGRSYASGKGGLCWANAFAFYNIKIPKTLPFVPKLFATQLIKAGLPTNFLKHCRVVGNNLLHFDKNFLQTKRFLLHNVAVGAERNSTYCYTNLTSKIRLLIKINTVTKNISGCFQKFTDTPAKDLLHFSSRRLYSQNPNYARIALDCHILRWMDQPSNRKFSYSFYNPDSLLGELLTSFICLVALRNKQLRNILNYYPSKRFGVNQMKAWNLNKIFLNIPIPKQQPPVRANQQPIKPSGEQQITQKRFQIGPNKYLLQTKIIGGRAMAFRVFRNSEAPVIVINRPGTARIFFNNTLFNRQYYIPSEALMCNNKTYASGKGGLCWVDAFAFYNRIIPKSLPFVPKLYATQLIAAGLPAQFLKSCRIVERNLLHFDPKIVHNKWYNLHNVVVGASSSDIDEDSLQCNYDFTMQDLVQKLLLKTQPKADNLTFTAILNKAVEQLHDWTRRRTDVTISVCLSINQKKIVAELFPEFKISYSGISYSSHPLFTAVRELENYCIFNRFKGKSFIDFGGNVLTHYRLGCKDTHICCPIVDIKDSARTIDRTLQLDYTILHDVGITLCDKLAQECDAPADRGCMVEVYDMSLADIAKAMISHGIKQFFFYICAPGELLSDFDTINLYNGACNIVKTGDQVTYYYGGSAEGYTHNLTKLRELMSRHFIKVNGHCFRKTLEVSRGPFQLFSIVLVPSIPPGTYDFTTRIANHQVSKILVKVPVTDKFGNITLTDLIVDKSLVVNLVEYTANCIEGINKKGFEHLMSQFRSRKAFKIYNNKVINEEVEIPLELLEGFLATIMATGMRINDKTCYLARFVYNTYYCPTIIKVILFGLKSIFSKFSQACYKKIINILRWLLGNWVVEYADINDGKFFDFNSSYVIKEQVIITSKDEVQSSIVHAYEEALERGKEFIVHADMEDLTGLMNETCDVGGGGMKFYTDWDIRILGELFEHPLFPPVAQNLTNIIYKILMVSRVLTQMFKDSKISRIFMKCCKDTFNQIWRLTSHIDILNWFKNLYLMCKNSVKKLVSFINQCYTSLRQYIRNLKISTFQAFFSEVEAQMDEIDEMDNIDLAEFGKWLVLNHHDFDEFKTLSFDEQSMLISTFKLISEGQAGVIRDDEDIFEDIPLGDDRDSANVLYINHYTSIPISQVSSQTYGRFNLSVGDMEILKSTVESGGGYRRSNFRKYIQTIRADIYLLANSVIVYFNNKFEILTNFLRGKYLVIKSFFRPSDENLVKIMFYSFHEVYINDHSLFKWYSIQYIYKNLINGGITIFINVSNIFRTYVKFIADKEVVQKIFDEVTLLKTSFCSTSLQMVMTGTMNLRTICFFPVAYGIARYIGHKSSYSKSSPITDILTSAITTGSALSPNNLMLASANSLIVKTRWMKFATSSEWFAGLVQDSLASFILEGPTKTILDWFLTKYGVLILITFLFVCGGNVAYGIYLLLAIKYFTSFYNKVVPLSNIAIATGCSIKNLTTSSAIKEACKVVQEKKFGRSSHPSRSKKQNRGKTTINEQSDDDCDADTHSKHSDQSVGEQNLPRPQFECGECSKTLSQKIVSEQFQPMAIATLNESEISVDLKDENLTPSDQLIKDRFTQNFRVLCKNPDIKRCTVLKNYPNTITTVMQTSYEPLTQCFNEYLFIESQTILQHLGKVSTLANVIKQGFVTIPEIKKMLNDSSLYIKLPGSSWESLGRKKIFLKKDPIFCFSPDVTNSENYLDKNSILISTSEFEVGFANQRLVKMEAMLETNLMLPTVASVANLVAFNQPPGSGKTTNIAQHMVEAMRKNRLCLAVTATRVGCSELQNMLCKLLKVSRINNVHTIDSFVLHGQRRTVDLLLIDECYMAHSGQLCYLLANVTALQIEFFGDRNQIPYTCRIDDFVARYASSLFKYVKIVEDDKSYRCPADVCYLLSQLCDDQGNHLYSKGVCAAKNPRLRTMCVKEINGAADIEFDKNTTYITYTQAAKTELNNMFNIDTVRTINEIQGATRPHITLVRLDNFENPLYRDTHQFVTAISRHTETFTYLTTPMNVNDTVGGAINSLTTIADCVIAQFGFKQCV